MNTWKSNTIIIIACIIAVGLSVTYHTNKAQAEEVKYKCKRHKEIAECEVITVTAGGDKGIFCGKCVLGSLRRTLGEVEVCE